MENYFAEIRTSNIEHILLGKGNSTSEGPLPSNLHSSTVPTIYRVVYSIYLMPAIENRTNKISVAQNAIKKAQVTKHKCSTCTTVNVSHWLCTIIDVLSIFVGGEGVCVVGWVRNLSASYTYKLTLVIKQVIDKCSTREARLSNRRNRSHVPG